LIPRDFRRVLCDESRVARLKPAEIKTALAGLPEWTRRGATITRTFVFKDFPAAIRFVHRVARLAEKAWHHPDIDIRWNKVTLSLTTHDEGGLTEKDMGLARRFDQQQARRREGTN
jgi:4a-hydroxytetrahydrobiopterin dehydratase